MTTLNIIATRPWRLPKIPFVFFVSFAFCQLLPSQTAIAEVDANQAKMEELVKNSPCLDNQTVEETLKAKIHSHSQRDLGWQVFNEGGHFEVERAFLMNKSMQLRFRWAVNEDGSIKPVSSRAESLCSKEESD